MKQISSFRALKGLVTLALIALGTSYASAQYYVNVMQKDGTRIQYSVDDIEQVSITDHKLPNFKAESVDLGLSVRWATCNLGANRPNERGIFVRWGETTEMDTVPYKWYDTETDKYTKYNLYERLGIVDMKYRLDPQDDIANVGAGPQWRIPSDEELQELIDSCNWVLTDSGGVKGYLVQSKKNGNSIFLPTTGFSINGNILVPEYVGAYLSNTLRLLSSTDSRLLYFNLDTVQMHTFGRQIGLPVRPVYSSDFGNNILQVSGIELDTASLELKVGQNYTLQVTGKMPDNTTIKLGAGEWSTSDKNVAVIEDGKITAVGEGTCTITASFGGKTASCAVTVIDPSKPQDPVDLGLSVKWATFNVGATSPYEYGDYYSWGEIATKTRYTWENYKYCNDGNTSMTKYNNDAQYGYNGFTDGKYTLEPDDDVAHIKWGGNWRMPSRGEMQELVDSCDWDWTNENGVWGYRITSLVSGYDNKSIFLPVGGYMSGVDTIYADYYYYWSSSLYSTSSLAYGLSEYYGGVDDLYRFIGCNVRPVSAYNVSDINDIQLTKNVLALALNSECTLDINLLNSDGRKIGVNGSMDINWRTSNSSVATVINGVVKAVGAGTCTITATMGSLSAECSVTVKDPSTVTPESVDLGLSVKWATFNIGAFRAEMFGDYFAWADPEPYYESGYSESSSPIWKSGKESGYDWSSYFDTNDGGNTFLKYNKENKKTVIDPEDDPAWGNWGDSWRIPLYYEFQELIDSCSWVLTDSNGVNGYKITSKVKGYESNSIFIPFTGYREDVEIEHDDCGYYWSASTDPGSSEVMVLGIDADSYVIYDDSRYWGQSYRPVQMFDDSGIQDIILNETDTTLLIGKQGVLFVRGVLADGHAISVSGAIKWVSSDEDVVTVVNGYLQAEGAGTASVTATYMGHSQSCIITVVDPYAVDPEYVDLGLSVKWASFNLGAYKAEMSGDYFAWGETEPKSNYSWSTYKYCDYASGSSLTKYCLDSDYGYEGFTDGKVILDASDDAVYVLMGDGNRMPTVIEMTELLSMCNREKTAVNGVIGYRFTSKVEGYENNSIFLPICGFYNGTNKNLGVGRYWTSSLLDATGGNNTAWYLYMSANQNNATTANYPRSLGFNIRPVTENTGWAGITAITLNKSNTEIELNGSETLVARLWSGEKDYTFYSPVSWSSDDESIVTVDKDGTIHGVGCGTASVTATYGNLSKECEVTVGLSFTVTGQENSIDYVDLGLSVKWATYNVGATTPTGYGDYFAWGEIETKGYFDWTLYKFRTAGIYTPDIELSKYNTSNSNGPVDNKTTLELNDDVAHVKWGGNWRMPTKAELDELCSNCTWTWTTLNGVNGCLITSNIEGYTNRFIFLPAAGYYDDDRGDTTYIGYYWSNSLDTDAPYDASYAVFGSAHGLTKSGGRWIGFSVRPVCP